MINIYRLNKLKLSFSSIILNPDKSEDLWMVMITIF